MSPRGDEQWRSQIYDHQTLLFAVFVYAEEVCSQYRCGLRL